MARNKHPEITYERIVLAATELFVENGYYNTSVQDIVDKVGLSKGAIYHHFESKEEILKAVLERRARHTYKRYDAAVREERDLTGKEKIQRILLASSNEKKASPFDSFLMGHMRDPFFAVDSMRSSMKYDAPMLSKWIREGVADGSLDVEEPELCAEMILVLFNLWAGPMMFYHSRKKTERIFKYLQHITKLIGANIITDQQIEAFLMVFEENGIWKQDKLT